MYFTRVHHLVFLLGLCPCLKYTSLITISPTPKEKCYFFFPLLEFAALKLFHMFYSSIRSFVKMLSIVTGFLMVTDLFWLILQTVRGLKMRRCGQCVMRTVKADQTQRMEWNCTWNHQLCSWVWPPPAHTKTDLLFKAEFLGKLLLVFKRRML